MLERGDEVEIFQQALVKNKALRNFALKAALRTVSYK